MWTSRRVGLDVNSPGVGVTTVLLIGIVLTMSVPTCVKAAPSSHLRVLTYHRFDTSAWISTPTSRFKGQINYLRENDYQFLTVEQVYHHVKSGRSFPEKSVLLMIDDGYRSVHYNAYPFLKKHDIPFVLSIYPRAQEEQFSAYIGWDTVARMAKDPLVHIGNHGYSHESLVDIGHDTEALKNEVTRADTLIERHTGERPIALVLPYGIYDRTLLTNLKKLDRNGDRLIFSSLPGIIEAGQNRLPYNRFMVDRHTDTESFKSKLRRAPMAVETSIRDGSHLDSAPRHLEFYFNKLVRLSQSNINVFLNGTNLTDQFTLDDELGRGRLTIPANVHSSWNQLLILGLDKHTRRYRMKSTAFVAEKRDTHAKTTTKIDTPYQTKPETSPETKKSP